MPRPPSTGSGARRTRCTRCGAPVLRQLVGRRAALDVTADEGRVTAAAAGRLREANRLDWCVRTTRDGPELRWADCHRRDGPCPHEHVIDHQCTAPPPAAQRRTSTTTSVPDGQLTL
ncbi:hypothetical protein ACLQ2N_08380 [Streptomyces sp. DT224]|uniref:hypothetical protein n=1 Tax=Streptomyces sp. DT224 TaxID=3393426 RepID=UPI003CF6F31F